MPTPLTDLQVYVEDFIEQYEIPALSVALWQDGNLNQAAAGCLNQNTGITATTDAIFQIGSITKVMTTSLMMLFVDKGLINLDKPVKHYLRDFMIADAEATRTITVRQLLNHTSGIAGDYFPDDQGQQGNLIARAVDRCSLLPLVHPVGEMYSYSNAAFCVIGRLIEVVSGLSWYEAMENYIYQPLGMDHAIADPKEMIRYRTAMGHIYDANNKGGWVLPERAFLSLGYAPVGSTPAMSAENLIRFARAHMEEGLNQQGQTWLSADSVQAMQTSQMKLPKISELSTSHAGLGWAIREYSQEGMRVVGHTGGTRGFYSNLQLVPEKNIAFVALMNAVSPSAMAAVTADLLCALTDVSVEEPEPDSVLPQTQLSHYVGLYESFNTIITVNIKENTLHINIVYKHDPLPPLDLTLRHIEEGLFAAYTPSGERGGNISFLKSDQQGRPQYVFNGGRLNQRLDIQSSQ